MSMITGMEIHNLYSSDECDSMLSETVEKVFAKQDDMLREKQREFDYKLTEQRREFDVRMLLMKEQIDKDHDELKASRRWLIGTIVTVGMGLAAYLSALIKISH